MKVLFATTNEAKIKRYADKVRKNGIEVLSLLISKIWELYKSVIFAERFVLPSINRNSMTAIPGGNLPDGL